MPVASTYCIPVQNKYQHTSPCISRNFTNNEHAKHIVWETGFQYLCGNTHTRKRSPRMYICSYTLVDKFWDTATCT